MSAYSAECPDCRAQLPGPHFETCPQVLTIHRDIRAPGMVDWLVTLGVFGLFLLAVVVAHALGLT